MIYYEAFFCLNLRKINEFIRRHKQDFKNKQKIIIKKDLVFLDDMITYKFV